MMIVIDVNVILSVLIKDSTTRELIVKSNQEFCFPEPAMQKIRKYKSYIKEKSGLSDLDFMKLFYTLMKFIRIIPTEELLGNWEEANRIMAHIDEEDVTFIATALSQEEAVIWSDDHHFDKQQRIVTLKTHEMVALFKD